MPETVGPVARWGRLAATLLFALWGFAILRDPSDTLVHLLTLPIHETGHYLFLPFGELMSAAGGSIFQLLFPALFIWHFWRQGDRHAATFPLWFVGVSAADLSVYIKDAHADGVTAARRTLPPVLPRPQIPASPAHIPLALRSLWPNCVVPAPTG